MDARTETLAALLDATLDATKHKKGMKGSTARSQAICLFRDCQAAGRRRGLVGRTAD